MTPTTLALYRTALLEVMAENLWSWDRLAGQLSTDVITLRRFMQQSAPENRNQQLRERWLIAKVDGFLESYKPGPKPQPTRRVTTQTLEMR